MTALVVDIGNSKIACGLVAAGVLRARARFAWSAPATDATLEAALSWCAAQAVPTTAVDGCAVASVVPQLSALWRTRWARAVPQLPAPLWIDGATPKPFTVAMADPDGVGADRYCNVAGALAAGHRSAIVVDLGTANTFDVLHAGTFEGGLIAVGLDTAHRALLAAGARLPDLPLVPSAVWLGRETHTAIVGGSWLQGVGGVQHVILGLRERFPDAAVLLTGGLAVDVAASLTVSTIVLPELTLLGAAALLEHARSGR